MSCRSSLVVLVMVALGCTESDPATAPLVVSSPGDVMVVEPDPGTFMAELDGTYPIDVQWQRSTDGVNWIDEGAQQTLVASPAITTLQTGATTVADSGAQYRVLAFNTVASSGISTSAATLTVMPLVIAPALLADLRDVSVAEGATAVMTATITGTALTYQWEEATPSGSFAVLAGQIGPTLTLPGVTLGMNHRRYRVTATNALGSAQSREARLSVFPASSLASMYVQYGPVNTVLYDPALATATGANHDAIADLAAGTLAVRADARTSMDPRFTYAGTSRGLVFVNNTGAAVTIPAGSIRLVVEGTYMHDIIADSGANARIDAALIVRMNGMDVSAGGRHQWAIRYDSNGLPLATSYSRFEVYTQSNGGTAVASVATYSALSMEIQLPALAMAPGNEMTMTFNLFAFAGEHASTNAFTIPAKVEMKLPAGVTLDRSTAVPLAWVTN